MSKTPVLKVVQDFMLKENRPYGLNDIVEKCGKELGKSAMQKYVQNMSFFKAIVFNFFRILLEL